MVGSHALFTSIINGNIRCILSVFTHLLCAFTHLQSKQSLYLKKFSEVRTASGEHHLVVDNIIIIFVVDIIYY